MRCLHRPQLHPRRHRLDTFTRARQQQSGAKRAERACSIGRSQ
jgi:hypothetical protein